MAWALSMALFVAGADSPIKSDEVVVFFPTTAHLDAAGKSWSLPIHGWIYEPDKDSIRRKLAIGMLRRALGLDADAEETAVFRDRAHLFLVDNERGKKLSIRMGGKVYPLDESEANGHCTGMITLTAAEADILLVGAKDRWIEFEAVMPANDKRSFRGQVRLVPSTGFTVISDIDDTIKISQVRDKKALLANTFLKEFEPVPEMAALFQEWAGAGASFAYVSASPWQLYPPL